MKSKLLIGFMLYAAGLLLDTVIDSRHGGVEKDLGEISEQIENWEESLPAHLGLKPAEVAHIKNQHRDNLKLQT